jgi:hypothetical protein
MIIINATEIKVKRMAAITEPLISIYNEEKIKVAATFDNKGVYTYELAVPLKYFGLSINDSQKFSYGIKIASRLDEPKVGMRTRYTYANGVQTDIDQDLDSTTNFWGEYTLKEKIE